MGERCSGNSLLQILFSTLFGTPTSHDLHAHSTRPQSGERRSASPHPANTVRLWLWTRRRLLWRRHRASDSRGCASTRGSARASRRCLTSATPSLCQRICLGHRLLSRAAAVPDGGVRPTTMRAGASPHRAAAAMVISAAGALVFGVVPLLWVASGRATKATSMAKRHIPRCMSALAALRWFSRESFEIACLYLMGLGLHVGVGLARQGLFCSSSTGVALRHRCRRQEERWAPERPPSSRKSPAPPPPQSQTPSRRRVTIAGFAPLTLAAACCHQCAADHAGVVTSNEARMAAQQALDDEATSRATAAGAVATSFVDARGL